MKKSTLSFVFLSVSCLVNIIWAADCNFRLPMDIPLDLAATFAELRPNHFHGGLDMRTEQVTGKTVYAVEDGFVSRISVSGTGYGNCLYIDHPCGITSVYAHLDSFEDRIADVLRAKQYEKGQFNVDFELGAGELPVTRGEFIALSGNSGSSTGPHLHFEFRKTGTDRIIDPQDYYEVYDNVRPKIHEFALVPSPGFGIVDNSAEGKLYGVIQRTNGLYVPKTDTIRAWGILGLELRSNDYLPSNRFKFGLRHVRLAVDGEICFEYDNDHFHMDSTRYINAFIDYGRWYDTGDMFMRCHLLPNSYKDVFKNVKGGGYLNINEQRIYDIRVEVEDYKGNSSRLEFAIKGDSTIIPVISAYNGGIYFPWNYYNEFKNGDVELTIPARSLYDDCFFTYTAETDSTAFSDVHKIGDERLPMQECATLKLRVKSDTLPDKGKYYIAQRSRRGNAWYFAGTCKYDSGFVQCRTRSFGAYKVLCDTVPPVISSPRKTNGGISFKVSDCQSGIKYFTGTVDKQFAIFYIDNKRGLVYCDFDTDKVLKGRNHSVFLTVFDNCGNRADYETFVWW